MNRNDATANLAKRQLLLCERPTLRLRFRLGVGSHGLFARMVAYASAMSRMIRLHPGS